MQVGTQVFAGNYPAFICRWMSPDSLRAYARVGQGGFVSWLGKAEKAMVDARQTANLPSYNNVDGFALLHQGIDSLQDLPERTQEVLTHKRQMDPPTSSPQRQPNPPYLKSPPPMLEPSNCVGRTIKVPRKLWPAYACDELDGSGWVGCISEYSDPYATVSFLHATTSSGQPYQPVKLKLSVLKPI